MHTASTPPDHAFRTLERALTGRRLASLDPMLRLELLAIALLVSGFVFWQSRLSVAAAAAGESGSALRALGTLARSLGLIVGLGAALAGTAFHRTLTSGAPGPAWLALPIPASRSVRHLRDGARLHALWMAPPLAAVLLSAAGLVPLVWLLLTAAGAALLLHQAARLACALARRIALWSTPRAPGPDASAALLVHAARHTDRASRPAAAWRSEPGWRALLRQDWRQSVSPGDPRARVVPALALTAAAGLVWAVPALRALAPVAGLALSLLAAMLFARWIIALVAADPPSVLRPLPLGLGAVWSARVVWAALAAVTLLAAQAGAATALDPPAHRLFSIWIAAAAFLIAVLGANYAVSLYPRRDAADRVFTLTLGLSVAASVMMPMMGWLVLLTAVLHSLRRLARWRTPEEI